MNEEIKNKAVELSDEEIETVTGGLYNQMKGSATCKKCGRYYEFVLSNDHTATPPCPYCGFNPSIFTNTSFT